MSKVFAIKALLAVVAMVVLMGFVSAGSAWASEPFGIETFENVITTEKGEPVTQAGSHPYAMTTTVVFNHHAPTEIEEEGGYEVALPNGDPKEVQVNLPAGIVVNPAATTQKCTEAALEDESRCPVASAVGIAEVKIGLLGIEETTPVYNMIPPPGVPAEFAFNAVVSGVYVHIIGGVRAGGDYGLSARVSEISQDGGIYFTSLTLWGDPSAESHAPERAVCARNSPGQREAKQEQYYDAVKEAVERGESIPTESEFFLKEEERPANCPAESTGKALLTMPTSCTGAPLKATMSAISWQEPDNKVEEEATSPTVTGCKELGFGPTLSVQPSEPATPATESPTGVEVDLKVPQEEGLHRYELLAKADLKEAEVKLPAGLMVSPSATNGLGTCSEAQIELNGPNTPTCSDSSKLGAVEIVTPLLETPLRGSVYLSQQGNLPGNGSNPFHSLFALYIVAEGSGVIIKVPGEIELKESGQVTAKFGVDPETGFYLPQLPFSELRMRFFGGPRAPLVTSATCGTFTTTSVLTPWDGNPAVEPDSNFAVSSGCTPHPFSPTLTAGTTNPQAGGYTPETVTIARENGEQHLSGVTITTPPGLLGMLSKVPLCGEQQANEGTCGEASQIGETTVAVGPGEDPYWVKGGHVYLTGPYNHQPFGLSIVVPTTAGPFTLKGDHPGVFGKEVVRASIAVNPKTGAITIASEPLPQMLEGVPLDVRTINVDINRGEFAFNPTNCEELHVTSSMTSAEGATATPSSRFEAANCAALPFHPTFEALTRGKSSEIGNGASLNVKVTQKQGEAAIRSVHLELPKKLSARLSTLQKACTEAVFDANPANCPSASDVGKAVAHTPVLPVPLEGPAYFVSHGGAKYPELVFVLQGDGVTIDLASETNINPKTKITSSMFATVPDAPITSFEANLPEEANSALSTLTPEGLCIYNTKHLSMPTTLVGQNGAQVKQTTKVAITGCPKKSKKPKKPKRHHKKR